MTIVDIVIGYPPNLMYQLMEERFRWIFKGKATVARYMTEDLQDRPFKMCADNILGSDLLMQCYYAWDPMRQLNR